MSSTDHITKEDLAEFGDALKDKIVIILLDKMDKMEEKYVRKEEFFLPKTMIYSLAGMILVAAVGAMITIVIPKINSSSAYEVSQK